MSAFARHGIEHVSPSALNLWATAPALYVTERLLKMRGQVGPPAHAGTAAESGIAYGLLNPDATLEECQKRALEEFGRLTALMPPSEAKDKYVKVIPLFVERGLAELRQYGVPSSLQQRVEHRVEGLEVPIIGFLDFLWEDKGVLVDLKTTLRMPSEIKTSHARQLSLYKACISDNLDARILYTTDKKAAALQLENHREHLRALEKMAFSLQRFLSISDDPHELAAIVCPDYESFYWNDPVTRANGMKVFGF